MKRFYSFLVLQVITSTLFAADSQKNQINKDEEISGDLLIYSVLSNKAAEPLLASFKQTYPKIHLIYEGDSGSNEINTRFEEEIKSKGTSADVMWSSAIDSQMRYVKDGYALPYQPRDAHVLPSWAVHKNLAWGTTFEPVVLVFNKNLLSENLLPTSHDHFLELIKSKSNLFKDKITLFDPQKSSVGQFFKSQDLKNYVNAGDLYQSFLSVNAYGSAGTGEMLTKINSGEFLFGYNIMGSYALSRSKRDLQNINIIYPKDYTLVLSRVLFISNKGKNPKAAQTWVDFLLSKKGQKILADDIELNSIRSDIDSSNTASEISRFIGRGVKPVSIAD